MTVAEDSWPKSSRNGGTITDYEHEQLVAPTQHSGLIGQPTDPALVYGDSTGLQFKVRANRYGMVRAREWFSGSVEYTKAIAANSSGATRLDLVVLRYDRASNAVTLEVRQGTPGQARPAPVQQTPPTTAFGTGIWELPVAEVKMVSGAATIAAGDVTYLAWYIGPDGSILCTDTTRPYGATPYPGMEIYENNTGVFRRWDGATWPMSKPWRRVVALTATQGSVTFSGIPTWLKNLKLTISARGDTAVVVQDLYMQINGDTGTNYFGIRRKITQATETINNYATSGVAQIGLITGASAGGGRFANVIVEIAGWEVSSKPLDAMYRAAAYPSGATSMYEDGSTSYNIPAAYTSIKLVPNTGSFVAGSSFVLEGWD